MNREGPIKRACAEMLAIFRRQGLLDFWYNHSTGIFHGGKWRARSSPFDRNGVADIVGVLKGGRALFIEIKAKGGHQSEAQKAFQKSVEAFGAEYLIVYSTRDIVDGMKRIFKKHGIIQTVF